MRLDEELHRIADRAPVAQVPPDTWSRGRRAHRRDRALAIAGVAALVALVAGVVAVAPWNDEPPVTGSTAALPTRLWDAPAEADLEQAPDLALGRVSAAYLGYGDGTRARVVIVGATDGAYRTVHLPMFSGRDGANAAEQYLALSPDGSQLAYSWAADARRTGPTPTGVRIVDLVSGQVRIVRLTGGQGVLVNRMAWSPNGRWLVWSGQVATSWRPGGRSFGDQEAAGLIAPSSTTSIPLPPNPHPEGARQYDVSDDGTVAISDTHRLTLWRDGRTIDERSVRQGSSFSGQAFLTGDEVVDLRYYYLDAHPPVLVHHTADADTADPLPSTFLASTPIGWTRAGVPLVEVANADGESGAIWRLTAKPEQVIGEPDGTLEGLTIASALDPSADLPDPDWAKPDHRWRPWILAGGAALLIGAAALVVRRRRSVRQGSAP